MSWNPLKKKALSKQASFPVPPSDSDNDFEKQLQKLKRLDESSKKLYRDFKRCTECLADLAKNEQKLTSNLSASHLCHYDEKLRTLAEDYFSIAKAMDQNTNELILVSQKAVLDPVKKYNNIFVALNTSLKKRDQLSQECQKCQIRLEKQQEKEKTGPNIVKLNQLKKQFEHAQEEASEHTTQLASEIPQFYDSRLDYFNPCLEAFVRCQVENCGRTTHLFSELAKDAPTVPTIKTDTQLQQKLAEIKALSIVAD
uniref:BAR domain-containing protein n=1 Tax=Strigamia maritima TaxID=126957 RepID=T1IIW4_STRMM